MNFDQERIKGVVRHTFTTLGGVAVGLGYAESESVTELVAHIESIVGGVFVVAGIVWSWVNKARS